jgi:hypothetical protein
MQIQNPDLGMPEGLSDKGQKAHAIIVEYLVANGLTRTEVQAFYAPAEWCERGEEYGRDSLLVVMYDGCAALKTAFSLDYCYEVVASRRGYPECYEHHTAMQAKLEEAGLRVEECTRWYAAIYAN